MSETNGRRARLFDEFSYPTYEEWREAAEKSLKGASFEKKLITRTYEDIDLQPLYRMEDAEGLAHTGSLPGFPPYVRGTSAAGYRLHPWDVCQELPYALPEECHQALRFDMERGQTAVNLVLDMATLLGKDASDAPASEVGQGGLSLCSAADLAVVLESIDLEKTPIFIQAGATALPIAAFMVALARQRGASLAKLSGCIGMDPLGVLSRSGSLPRPLDEAYTMMAQLAGWARGNTPNLQTVLVQGHPYHDGGASATQELAFALATAVEYLRALIDRGLSPDDAALSIRFSFSIGSNVFMEIAKLRAARLLWSRVVSAFGGGDEAQKMVIHARTSAWNKTAYDPYVNMLRATTESFSAVVGGTESLHTGCFDETLRPPDDFSRRIARNTQIVLQQEAHLTKVLDPAGGSWYVERLTDTVARNAWGIFQEVETQGGMFAALQSRYPQSQVDGVADARAKNIGLRRDVFVGTNMYPNLKEKPVAVPTIDMDERKRERTAQLARQRAEADQSRCEAALAALSQAPADVMGACVEAALCGATLGALVGRLRPQSGEGVAVEPVRIHRGAALFETLRKNAEAYAAKTGAYPQVFLANMGPIPQHKPRADFTSGFFEVGGFEVLRNNGFATVEEAAQAALNAHAPIVVICSTDDTYPDLVPPLTQHIKQGNPDAIVILAGYPKDQIEAHKAAGVDDFIHLRANCYETLNNLQQKIGVAV